MLYWYTVLVVEVPKVIGMTMCLSLVVSHTGLE